MARRTKQVLTAAEREAFKAAKRAESRELMETAARELLTSEGWQQWARTRGAFHRYSFGNCMLIASQCPEATRVAGFGKWQDLGRQVRKGERGIRILAPCPVKVTDADTGEEGTRVFFKPVSVFDVAQTDGDPLPEPPAGEPITGDSHAHLLPTLTALAAEIGWTVETGETGSADGYAHYGDQRIRLSDRLDSPNRQVRTLIHEIIHALGVSSKEHGRETAEVLTETAAYVACRSLGLDTAGMSIPYVAGWGEETDLNAIREYASVVDAMARRVETACEQVAA